MIPREGKSHGYGASSRGLLKFSLSDFMTRLIQITVLPKTLVVEVESLESRKSQVQAQRMQAALAAKADDRGVIGHRPRRQDAKTLTVSLLTSLPRDDPSLLVHHLDTIRLSPFPFLIFPAPPQIPFIVLLFSKHPGLWMLESNATGSLRQSPETAATITGYCIGDLSARYAKDKTPERPERPERQKRPARPAKQQFRLATYICITYVGRI